MSIPPKEPLNPIDLSTHVSHKAHEGAVTEDNASPRSPQAPKRAHLRAATEQHPVENDRDPLRSPHAPGQARAQPAVTSDFAARDDAGPLPPVRAPGGLRKDTERHAVGADEPHLRSHEAVHPNIGRHAQRAAEHRDENISDRDLDEPLEASLRRLQRQESATRPPRAHLPPLSGFAPVHANNRRHSGESAGNGLQSPRSLEPERLPPPPEMSRRNILAPLGIVVPSILVATIAYYFAMGGWVPPSEPSPGPQTRSFDPTVIAPLSWSTGQQASWPTMAQDNDLATSEQSEISTQRTKTSQPARSSEGKTMAMVQPGEPGAQIPPASKATRVLDPEEIKLLMKQGQQFIAAGDVVTARNVFQRAAEAGDADAAVALGGTYDPIAFAKLGVAGLRADVEKARTWYQKAESLGSAEATRRLAILANRNFTPMRHPMR
jgi:hypothetical protein